MVKREKKVPEFSILTTVVVVTICLGLTVLIGWLQ